MINPFNLPAIGGALLAAVVVGIHLGESAVGLINPIHFQGPALHPRDRGAAIDPEAVRSRPAAFDELYGWEEGITARDTECGDCAAPAARDAYDPREGYAYSAVVPYFGGETVVEPPPDPVEPVRKPEPVRETAVRETPVERYAYYPVSVEEPRRPVPSYAADDVYLPPAGDPDGKDEPAYE